MCFYQIYKEMYIMMILDKVNRIAILILSENFKNEINNYL